MLEENTVPMLENILLHCRELLKCDDFVFLFHSVLSYVWFLVNVVSFELFGIIPSDSSHVLIT